MAIKVRTVKKKWYPILAPKVFNEQFVGEIPLYDIKSAIGRDVSVNLMVLTNDPKKQNVNVTFKMKYTDGDNIRTEFTGYNLIPSFMKRLIRKRKLKLNDSFTAETSDHKKIRIKPIIVANGIVKGVAKADLIKNTREIIKKGLLKTSYESLVRELIMHKFQFNVKDKLKKTYPVAIFEIKSMEIEKEVKREGVEEVKEVAKEEKKEVKQKEVKKEEVKEVKEEETKKEIKEVKKEETISKK